MAALAGASSQAYFALAIVLLKLKPHGVTVEDFIVSLRQSLTSSAGQDAPPVKPMLNVAALWQSLFTRSQQQNQQQGRQLIALQSEGQQQSRKRRHDHVKSPSKRRKLDIIPDIDIGSDENEVEGQNPDRIRLLRIILRLAQISPKDMEDGVNGKETVQLMRAACVEVIGSVKTSDDRSTDTQAAKSAGLYLHEACHGAKSIWSLMTKCLREQRPARGDTKLLGRLVPALSSVVQFLLGRLHQYCLDEADERSKSSSMRTKSRRSNIKATIQNNARRTELSKHNCGTISALLAHILASTTALHQICPALFEAVACAFLDHLGSSISLHLFGDPERKDDTVGLAPPRGPQDVAHIDSADAITTTRLEAPYLVHILRALTRGSKRNGANGPLQSFSINNFSASSFGATKLERLQNTLLRGIFDDEDGTFANAFDPLKTNDVTVHSVTEMFAELDENDKDWFLSQVWENLGWDSLLRKTTSNSGSKESTAESP